jgi:hypothetical protein
MIDAINLVSVKMLGAEPRQWRCVENRAKQNQLVESSRLLPIVAEKNCDQSDHQNRPKGKNTTKSPRGESLRRS